MNNTGEPRRTPENPGEHRRTPENLGEPRRSLENPGEPRRTPQNTGEYRRNPENPGEPRSTPNNSGKSRYQDIHNPSSLIDPKHPSMKFVRTYEILNTIMMKRKHTDAQPALVPQTDIGTGNRSNPNPTSPLGRECFRSHIFPSSNPILPLRMISAFRKNGCFWMGWWEIREA